MRIAPKNHVTTLGAPPSRDGRVAAASRFAIKKGRGGAKPHNYKRNGATPLFAAMDAVEGRLGLQLIANNDATHKHLKVKTWLKRLPRFLMHFIPTSSSRLNLLSTGSVCRPANASGAVSSTAFIDTPSNNP